eukprot:m.777859 g.777859  ORF g.777859 m.777859 type:complete len:523 (+) comp23269_c0_seq13:58-1626(+)
MSEIAMFLFPMLLFVTTFKCGSGAGMNTHTMVGDRTARFYGLISSNIPNASRFNEAIQRNLEAVHGGADFPDFGYACGANHSAGEAAHWPPWQAAGIEYVRSLPDFNSGKWTNDTEKLVAFLFGVSVHYIADELWEGLDAEIGRGQGFVRTLSSFNLGHSGLNDNDEGVANLAADFDVGFALNESGIKPWDRYFPIEDIVRIYKVSGNDNVTEESMSACRLLFDLGLWAEMTFGPLLFPLYAQGLNKVPLVQERYLDLPIGGLDDMSVWANWVWQRVARWFNTGPPPVVPPSNADATVAHTDKKSDGRNDHEGAWMQRFVREVQGSTGVKLSPQSARDLMVGITSWQQLFAVAKDDNTDGDPTPRTLWYIGPKHLQHECIALLNAFQNAISPLWRNANPSSLDTRKADASSQQAPYRVAGAKDPVHTQTDSSALSGTPEKEKQREMLPPTGIRSGTLGKAASGECVAIPQEAEPLSGAQGLRTYPVLAPVCIDRRAVRVWTITQAQPCWEPRRLSTLGPALP